MKNAKNAVLSILAIAAFTAAAAKGHPVRVYKDGDGWPHYFEVWNSSKGQYVHTILKGYENCWMGESDSQLKSKFDTMQKNRCDCIRIWLRPSDGYYAYEYNSSLKKVDVDKWNEDFFTRLDWILGQAESRGIVIEVMLWDRCTGWRGGGLPSPNGWNAWGNHAKNVHHPDNHYRSSAGNKPIPNLYTGDEKRIWNDQWYNTGNSTWMNYQKAYMKRVIDVSLQHDNATIELINEAPNTAKATQWRKYMQSWIHAQWPDVLTSGEALGGKSGQDENMRQWGENNPGKIEIVPTHFLWTYDEAQKRYHEYKGVLPGCNEHVASYDDLNKCRRVMWGLTLGGGVAYSENISEKNGAVVTRELHAFFYAPDTPISFSDMKPARNSVSGNNGTKYVLAGSKNEEFALFVDNNATTNTFHVNGESKYKYRWFTADGANSKWESWQTGSTWDFKPPRVNCGLHIIIDDATRAQAGIHRKHSANIQWNIVKDVADNSPAISMQGRKLPAAQNPAAGLFLLRYNPAGKGETCAVYRLLNVK